jgi:hypothetical protein
MVGQTADAGNFASRWLRMKKRVGRRKPVRNRDEYGRRDGSSIGAAHRKINFMGDWRHHIRPAEMKAASSTTALLLRALWGLCG